MVEAHRRQEKSARRLTVDFAAWLNGAHISAEQFFRSALIILDANVLLDLYRITPAARTQVLDTLGSVSDRIWVPHQAAIEFSRNRKQVVEDRISSFKHSRQILRGAGKEAVDVLESAVEQLLAIRERNGTDRAWDRKSAGLDRDSLLNRLAGVMDPALAELAALEAEHDLHLGDMQHTDPILSQVDHLLAGRIGPGYPPQELRTLVEEAHLFRFPNQIPPGFLDAGKKTQLHAAGDFLLWQQTIDRAAEITGNDQLILLITKDLKADWWELDAKKRPRGPRPELVQELRDRAGADLLLMSLKDFMEGAKTYLESTVSDETLNELPAVGQGVNPLLPGAFDDPLAEPNLLELSFRDFDNLIYYLMIQTGYEVEMQDSHYGDYGIDFLLVSPNNPSKLSIVMAKRYHRPIDASTVLKLRGALDGTTAESGILITTSWFTRAAKRAADDAPIQLIDGAKLLDLLANFGVHAKIQFEDD